MSLNRFMGIGNLTRNVEVREVGQSKVARFAIAMNEKYRKQDGTVAESTEFLEVEYWGNSGVFQYLLKGQMVYVEGSLKTEKWTGNDGIEKSSIKLRAREIQLLGGRQQQEPVQPQFQQPAPQRPQNPYQNFSQPSSSGYGQQVSYGTQEDLPLF